MKAQKVEVEVRLANEAGVRSLAKILRAADRILELVEALEARAMAADGPVTPTLRLAHERELRALWRNAKTIARTDFPELRVVQKRSRRS